MVRGALGAPDAVDGLIVAGVFFIEYAYMPGANGAKKIARLHPAAAAALDVVAGVALHATATVFAGKGNVYLPAGVSARAGSSKFFDGEALGPRPSGGNHQRPLVIEKAGEDRSEARAHVYAYRASRETCVVELDSLEEVRVAFRVHEGLAWTWPSENWYKSLSGAPDAATAPVARAMRARIDAFLEKKKFRAERWGKETARGRTLAALPPELRNKIFSELPPSAVARLHATSKNVQRVVTRNDVRARTTAVARAMNRAFAGLRAGKLRRVMAVALRVARQWDAGFPLEEIARAYDTPEISCAWHQDVLLSCFVIEERNRPNTHVEVERKEGYFAFTIWENIHDRFFVSVHIDISRRGKIVWRLEDRHLEGVADGHKIAKLRDAVDTVLREEAARLGALERLSRTEAARAEEDARAERKRKRNLNRGKHAERPKYTFWGIPQ